VQVNKLKLTKKQKRLWQTLVFLLKILAFAAPLYFTLFYVDLSALQEIVSQNAVLIFRSLGFDAAKDGFLLSVNGFSFVISQDCTGWKSMLFLTALIVAVPAVHWKKRAIGLAIGLPLLWFGNLLRILLIVFVGIVYGYEVAELIHAYLWQLGLISLVIGIWLTWLWWVGKIFKTKIRTNVHG
jgi:exosortase/archaeosortase family protein